MEIFAMVFILKRNSKFEINEFLEYDKFTLVEFINLTKNAYGSDMIHKLSAAIN